MHELVAQWPAAALAAGLLLLAWSQRAKIAGVLGDRQTSLTIAEIATPLRTVGTLTPHDLFARLYDLRTACEQAGQAAAVQALDDAVLPAIVRGQKKPEGGPTP